MQLFLYHISPVEPTLIKTYTVSEIEISRNSIIKDAVDTARKAHLAREEPYDFEPIVTFIEGAIGDNEATHMIQIGADVFVLAKPRVTTH